MLRAHFVAWKTPPVELPAESVIEWVVTEIIEATRKASPIRMPSIRVVPGQPFPLVTLEPEEATDAEIRSAMRAKIEELTRERDEARSEQLREREHSAEQLAEMARKLIEQSTPATSMDRLVNAAEAISTTLECIANRM